MLYFLLSQSYWLAWKHCGKLFVGDVVTACGKGPAGKPGWPFQYFLVTYILTISISFCHIHFDHFNIFLSDTYWPFQYFIVRYILTISTFFCQTHFDHFNILFCSDTFQPLQNLAPFLSYLLPEGLINPFDHLTFCCYSPSFAYSYYYIQLNRIIFLPLCLWSMHAGINWPTWVHY